MIDLKTPDELRLMIKSGEIVKEVMREIRPMCVDGVSTWEIDHEAQRLIKVKGGTGSFNTVKGYDWVTCMPINEQIVHTPPSKKRILKNGDVLTIDIGAVYQGFHSDYADTWVIGGNGYRGKEDLEFLRVGKETLEKAIEVARPGVRIGEISRVIQRGIEDGAGYHIAKQLTGHGLGRTLHEDPLIPGYVSGPIEKTPIIEDGLAIAIEVMYAKGTDRLVHEDDWSIITADRSLSAQFEHTLVCLEGKMRVIT